MNVRLNTVRKALSRAAAGEVTITDVAYRSGFWRMGQFDANYRCLFGELPSKSFSSL